MTTAAHTASERADFHAPPAAAGAAASHVRLAAAHRRRPCRQPRSARRCAAFTQRRPADSRALAACDGSHQAAPQPTRLLLPGLAAQACCRRTCTCGVAAQINARAPTAAPRARWPAEAAACARRVAAAAAARTAERPCALRAGAVLTRHWMLWGSSAAAAAALTTALVAAAPRAAAAAPLARTRMRSPQARARPSSAATAAAASVQAGMRRLTHIVRTFRARLRAGRGAP